MEAEQLMLSVLSASPEMRKKLESVLNGADKQSVGDKQDMRLVTISGAARILNVGRNVIYNLIRSERLDVVGLNGSRRITMRSLTAFVNGERPTNEKTDEIVAESKAHYAEMVKKMKEAR